MIDYKGLEALHKVQELESFEGAANALGITQSAVSQRIKGLETYYGEPVLIRSTVPYQLTRLGAKLIKHYLKVSTLEGSLLEELEEKESLAPVSVAINRDSLETWFMTLLDDPTLFPEIQLEIIADDQDITIDYFKKGIVSACLSTTLTPLSGCHATFLGNMQYHLVASPTFIEKHRMKTPSDLVKAPAIKFDVHDDLHDRYLDKYFGIAHQELTYHTVPSVQGFRKGALIGLGYALIPYIDIVLELQSGQLIDLFPDKTLGVPLYWHYWSIDSKRYQGFQNKVIAIARKKLESQDRK